MWLVSRRMPKDWIAAAVAGMTPGIQTVITHNAISSIGDIHEFPRAIAMPTQIPAMKAVQVNTAPPRMNQRPISLRLHRKVTPDQTNAKARKDAIPTTIDKGYSSLSITNMPQRPLLQRPVVAMMHRMRMGFTLI